MRGLVNEEHRNDILERSCHIRCFFDEITAFRKQLGKDFHYMRDGSAYFLFVLRVIALEEIEAERILIVKEIKQDHIFFTAGQPLAAISNCVTLRRDETHPHALL